MPATGTPVVQQLPPPQIIDILRDENGQAITDESGNPIFTP